MAQEVLKQDPFLCVGRHYVAGHEGRFRHADTGAGLDVTRRHRLAHPTTHMATDRGGMRTHPKMTLMRLSGSDRRKDACAGAFALFGLDEPRFEAVTIQTEYFDHLMMRHLNRPAMHWKENIIEFEQKSSGIRVILAMEGVRQY
jgi:hypothetical protein